MRKSAFDPCIPTRGTRVPAGPDWLHEIKHDGYRLIVQRDGKRVRLFIRNGYDWTDKYPLIVQAAMRIRSNSFVLDGEAVLLGVDGISDFDGLHSRQFAGRAHGCGLHQGRDRFLATVGAASRLRVPSFLIDGEGVACRDDGLSDSMLCAAPAGRDDVTLSGTLQFAVCKRDGTYTRITPYKTALQLLRVGIASVDRSIGGSDVRTIYARSVGRDCTSIDVRRRSGR